MVCRHNLTRQRGVSVNEPISRGSRARVWPHCLLLATVAATLALVCGCKKPQRHVPQGPGVAEAALAKTVAQIPKVDEQLKDSLLTPEQQAIVVAQIGPRKITLGQLEARLAGEPPVVRAQYSTTAKRKEYLASWVQFEVLAAEAVRQGMANDAKVLETARSQMVRRFLKEAVVDQLKAEDVNEADIKAYYEANLGRYHKPEQVELRHLMFSDRARAEKVREELDRGSSGSAAKLSALWKDYVGRVSEDKATASHLGSLGLVSREPPAGAAPTEVARLKAIPKALIDAAMALEPYTLGPIVQSHAGFHIIIITSRSPAVDKKLEDVRPSVRKRVLKRKRDEKRQALLAGLREQAKITVNDDAIRLLPPPGRRDRPKSAGAMKTGAPTPAPPPTGEGLKP